MFPLVILGGLCSCTGFPCTRLLSREDLEIFFQEEIFATGVCCTTSKVPNYRFTDTKARRNHLSCLSSCITQDIWFHPLIPASSPQLLSELDHVFCMPHISALFLTPGLFCVLRMCLQLPLPCPSGGHIIWQCCGAEGGQQLPGGQRTDGLWAAVQGAGETLRCGAGNAGVAAAVTGDWEPKLQTSSSVAQPVLGRAVKCMSRNHRLLTRSL